MNHVDQAVVINGDSTGTIRGAMIVTLAHLQVTVSRDVEVRILAINEGNSITIEYRNGEHTCCVTYYVYNGAVDCTLPIEEIEQYLLGTHKYSA